MLILLAERDPFAADFSEYFLRTEVYDASLVTTGEQAIAEMERKTPNLVVIDLLTSGGLGLQLCTRLRRQHDVPVPAPAAP